MIQLRIDRRLKRYPLQVRHKQDQDRKTARSRALCGVRCIGNAVRTWSAVCSEEPYSQFGEEARLVCAWTNGIAQHQSAGR